MFSDSQKILGAPFRRGSELSHFDFPKGAIRSPRQKRGRQRRRGRETATRWSTMIHPHSHTGHSNLSFSSVRQIKICLSRLGSPGEGNDKAITSLSWRADVFVLCLNYRTRTPTHCGRADLLKTRTRFPDEMMGTSSWTNHDGHCKKCESPGRVLSPHKPAPHHSQKPRQRAASHLLAMMNFSSLCSSCATRTCYLHVGITCSRRTRRHVYYRFPLGWASLTAPRRGASLTGATLAAFPQKRRHGLG